MIKGGGTDLLRAERPAEERRERDRPRRSSDIEVRRAGARAPREAGAQGAEGEDRAADRGQPDAAASSATSS